MVNQAQSKRTLGLTRWIWAVMLIGMVTTGGLATVVVYAQLFGPEVRAWPWLWAMSLGGTLMLCAVGYFLRMQTYKRYWIGNHISPLGYFAGNVILFALIYAAVLLEITIMVLAGRLIPEGLAVGLCVILLGVNFPEGKAMGRESPKPKVQLPRSKEAFEKPGK